MKIIVFIIEMAIGVIPATLLFPLTLVGSIMSIVGVAQDWMNIFNPFGLMGIFGVAGTIGLWFVVPQNAFKKKFKPDKVHFTLLALGVMAILPISYTAITDLDEGNFYWIWYSVGPLAVAIKYLYVGIKRRYLIG